MLRIRSEGCIAADLLRLYCACFVRQTSHGLKPPQRVHRPARFHVARSFIIDSRLGCTLQLPLAPTTVPVDADRSAHCLRVLRSSPRVNHGAVFALPLALVLGVPLPKLDPAQEAPRVSGRWHRAVQTDASLPARGVSLALVRVPDRCRPRHDYAASPPVIRSTTCPSRLLM